MKSILLIGDEANAARFIYGLEKTQLKNADSQYQVGHDIVSVKYQGDLEKAVRSKYSGVVVIGGNEKGIPNYVADYLPRISSQHTYFYLDKSDPLEFLKKVSSVIEPLSTFQSKLKHMLFGGSQNVKARPLSLQVVHRNKTPA